MPSEIFVFVFLQFVDTSRAGDRLLWPWQAFFVRAAAKWEQAEHDWAELSSTLYQIRSIYFHSAQWSSFCTKNYTFEKWAGWCLPQTEWNTIPWYSKRILCHCEGAEKCIFQTLSFLFAKLRHLVIMLHTSIDAACIYWKIFFGVKFFGAKICFRSYTIIIRGLEFFLANRMLLPGNVVCPIGSH